MKNGKFIKFLPKLLPELGGVTIVKKKDTIAKKKEISNRKPPKEATILKVFATIRNSVGNMIFVNLLIASLHAVFDIQKSEIERALVEIKKAKNKKLQKKGGLLKKHHNKVVQNTIDSLTRLLQKTKV